MSEIIFALTGIVMPLRMKDSGGERRLRDLRDRFAKYIWDNFALVRA
jgi:hypothetical protein